MTTNIFPRQDTGLDNPFNWVASQPAAIARSACVVVQPVALWAKTVPLTLPTGIPPANSVNMETAPDKLLTAVESSPAVVSLSAQTKPVVAPTLFKKG